MSLRIDWYPTMTMTMDYQAPATLSATVAGAQAGHLSWSLVVCTFKREKVLPRCVRCALASTRKPKQVVIVDASPYWQDTKAAIVGEFQPLHPDVEFVYVGARRASLTAQRNQGLELTTGDIAFMLDDDSLIFPDTAEKVMAVYEAPGGDKVVALTPVFVAEVPDAHLNIVTPGHPTQGHAGTDESKSSALRKLARGLLWSDVHLMPYDGREWVSPIPHGLEKFGLIPTRFSTGSATFRTDAVRTAKFEELLERYAAAEDWDISERIKHRGLIAFYPAARQCHLEAPGGRLSRRTVSTLKFCNFMALHVLHSTDVGRSRRQHRSFLLRRFLGEFLADLSKRRWDFSRARGTWRALKLLPTIFGKTRDELKAWYPGFQRQLVASDTGEERPR